MRTPTILSLALASIIMVSAPSAQAAPAAPSEPLGKKEVHINTERLAQLPLEDQQRVLAIKERLETIIATDRSTLDRNQRSELRSEWKQLKDEMKEYNRNGSVVYISTAGLIIIILLLIILL
ncbi:MAG: hypothetical protein IPN85_17595 [Flavobacteriales bacterium]|nr:hypothetical protein [Flavobacteriales bacterium]MBK9286756.1 hypothetical protein [Flavobacteriales bacterium]MBL0035243.1 hypothetical protein [Flavobacteriales bacterium]